MKRFLLTVPTVLMLSTPALAGPEERVTEALDAVEATPEQRDSVQAILDVAVPEMKAFHEEGRLLRDEIHELFHAEQIDRVALEDVRLDVVDLFDRATAAAFGHLADLSEVFSLEQREELRQLREERRRQWRERWTQL